jgi:hypothetical protein
MRSCVGAMRCGLPPRLATPRLARSFTTTQRVVAPSNAVTAKVLGDTRVLATYEGPLSATFRRLKLFSLGSLALASVLTPVLLLAPGEISMAGRVGLCITALATSGVSTALIAWIGTPYVGTMRLLATPQRQHVMELNTLDWRLRKQTTLVYEPAFLRPTSRPFAAWEVTNNAPAPRDAPQAETTTKVAETIDDKTGTSKGTWAVTYAPAADGGASAKVVVKGKPTRYFNVHEELLGEDWQVLG